MSNPRQVRAFWLSNAIDASQWAVAAMDLSTLHFGSVNSRCIPFYTSCLLSVRESSYLHQVTLDVTPPPLLFWNAFINLSSHAPDKLGLET